MRSTPYGQVERCSYELNRGSHEKENVSMYSGEEGIVHRNPYDGEGIVYTNPYAAKNPVHMKAEIRRPYVGIKNPIRAIPYMNIKPYLPKPYMGVEAEDTKLYEGSNGTVRKRLGCMGKQKPYMTVVCIRLYGLLSRELYNWFNTTKSPFSSFINNVLGVLKNHKNHVAHGIPCGFEGLNLGLAMGALPLDPARDATP